MKVAVSAKGEGLDSFVDSRFGRCAYFVVVDTDSGQVESFPNPSLSSAHGAGVNTVQFLSEKGVAAVCTQNVGPNGFSALSASGIDVYVAGEGTVAETIEQFKRGLLPRHRGATTANHAVPHHDENQ